MPTRSVSAPAQRPVTPVSLVAATLERLVARLDGGDAVDAEFRHELRSACDLAGRLDPYLSRCTTAESPALRALAEQTRAADWSLHVAGPTGSRVEQEMLSGHVEGQTLRLLVRLSRARRTLDVGMFTGYSALAMAEALPADGRVVACEVDPVVAAFARRCFDESPSGRKITVEVAPAIETLGRLAEAHESFDLVFVDADKPGYTRYFHALLDGGLLAPHGLLCVDNTLLQGEPYASGEPSANGAAIAAFNQVVADDPRVEQVLLPVRDGLTLIQRV